MRNSVTEIRKKIYNLKSSIADLPLPALLRRSFAKAQQAGCTLNGAFPKQCREKHHSYSLARLIIRNNFNASLFVSTPVDK